MCLGFHPLVQLIKVVIFTQFDWNTKHTICVPYWKPIQLQQNDYSSNNRNGHNCHICWFKKERKKYLIHLKFEWVRVGKVACPCFFLYYLHTSRFYRYKEITKRKKKWTTYFCNQIKFIDNSLNASNNNKLYSTNIEHEAKKEIIKQMASPSNNLSSRNCLFTWYYHYQKTANHAGLCTANVNRYLVLNYSDF